MGDADMRYMDNKSTPGKDLRTMRRFNYRHYNKPYDRPPPPQPPLLRTDSVDSQKSRENTLRYTPDGTPFDDTMGHEVDTGVDAQPHVYFENGYLIGFKTSILGEVRNTYIERKLNNYEVIINIHLKTIDDNNEEIEEIEEIIQQIIQETGIEPERGGGKKNKIRKNERGYKQNRFRKKNQKGGLCNDTTIIHFNDYIKPDEIGIVTTNGAQSVLNNTNISNSTGYNRTALLNSLLKILFMADNNKDFNLRTELYDLIDCLRAAFDFKDDHKIDLDKDTLYKEVIDVIERDASYGSMVVLSDRLIEMIQNGESFQLSSGSSLLMDGTPNIIGQTIDKTQRVITLADVFDSAGTQGVNAINTGLTPDEQIRLMNQGLAFLLKNYSFSSAIASIVVKEVHSNNLFNIEFTLQNKNSFVINEIKTGSDGVFTVDAISNQIKGVNNVPKLEEIKSGLRGAGIPQNEIDKLFNIILIYFKAAGDFMKIWFGFKIGSVPNFLTTQDIMFFVITMFLNFYHTYLPELEINKHTYVILGTGKTQADGKKIAFVNDDEYFLQKYIEDLVRTKISGIYHCKVELVDNVLTISLYLKNDEGYTLVKRDDNTGEDYIELIIFSGNIDPRIITAQNLRESKIKFAEIMKAVENVSSLVDNIGYNEKIKTFNNIIISKVKKIRGIIPRLQPYFTMLVQVNKLPNFIKCSNNILGGLNELLKHVVTYFNPEDLTNILLNLRTLNKDQQLLQVFFDYMDENIGNIVKALIDLITDTDTQSSLTTTIDALRGFINPIIEQYEKPESDDKAKMLAKKYNETYDKLQEPIDKNRELRNAINGILENYENAKKIISSGGKKSYRKKINNTQPILIHKQKIVKSIKYGNENINNIKSDKTIKGVKISKDKTIKSDKTVKDVKVSKSGKTVKDVKVSKDKTVKSNKTVKDVKPAKAIKDIKEVKDKAEKKLKIGKEKIMKNILGKDRRVYKITGDRKEYVKYKNELITVKEYIKRVKSNTKTNNKKIKETKKK